MRRSASVALIATGLLLGSCSKTQDTAPETRLFGSPPVIQNAHLIENSGVGVATCDITDIVKGYLCSGGVPPSSVDFPEPIVINVHYTEAEISVQATDPDTVPGGQNDILLVGASYQSSNNGSQKVESTLVVLDDGGLSGGINQFFYEQRTFEIPQACRPDPNLCADPSGVVCGTANYVLNSNDRVQNDNTWTRGFALTSGDTLLTSPTGINLAARGTITGDCIAKAKHQFPVIADVPVGVSVNFKIEVVDRAGNLTAWPQPLSTPFVKTEYDCGPDACACCLLLSSVPGQDCKGRPGLTGSGFPRGVCIESIP